MLRTIKGGQAIPLGHGFYYMRGRKHEQGGIDIGRNLEVEDGEVTQITPNSIKVFSAQPILNGRSPAQKVLGGDNPDRVFAEQENFKDRFNLKDDGSKKARFGIDKEHYKTDVEYRRQIIADAQARQSSKQVTRKGTNQSKTLYHSPIFDDNETHIAASEQGKMDRVNKQVADKERIDNGLKEGVKFVAENTPVIGDMITIKEATDAWNQGNKLEASIIGASMLLPFGVGKIIKKAKLAKAVNRAVKETPTPNTPIIAKPIYHREQPNLLTNDITKVTRERSAEFIKDRLRKQNVKEGVKTTKLQEDIIDNATKDVFAVTDDYTSYYTPNSNKLTMSKKHLDDYKVYNHETNHKLQHLLSKTITDEQDDIRRSAYRTLKQPSSNIKRATNESIIYSPTEQHLLDEAYSFSDEFLNSAKLDKHGNIKYDANGNVIKVKDDLSLLNEKAATNADTREILRDWADEFYKNDDNYNKLSNIEKYEFAINNADNTTILKALNTSSGYGADFYDTFITKVSDKGIDITDKYKLLRNNTFNNPIFNPFIKNIKTALYDVRTIATPIIGAGIGANIINNQTKDKKAMGGLVHVRPFTGARKKSVTVAALGTEEDYLKETINLPEVVITAPIKRTSSTAGVKPTKPTKRKTSPVTTNEDYTERSDNFRIPGIADVGIASKITKSDVSPVAKPTNPSLNTRTKNILASNKPTITKYNPFKNINTEEAIGIGSNILSSGISYLTNRRAINNMTPPSEPTMRFAPKLNTTVNINPQDDLLREAGFNIRDNITRNTTSSNVARNLINASNLSIVNARNQLYANKFNKETELINQDKLNRQAVADRNITEYNVYKDRVIDFNNRKADMQGENTIGLINGINSAVQDTIARRQADRALRTNAGISLAAYPNSINYLLNTVPELRKILKVG